MCGAATRKESPVPGKSNDSPPHGTGQDAERKSAPGAMLVSILLLIAVLLLTSALLLDSASARQGRTGKTGAGFSQALEKAKGLFAEAKSKTVAPSPSPSPQTKSSTPEKKGILGLSFGGKKKKGNVHWPRLKLSGFGKAAAGETGFAIINGKRVNVGDAASGATVVEVSDRGVELEYQGATRILTMEIAHQ
jgi:hypothetical protein